jgi:aerobic carbon-monoxide dehydrogenase large subunit
MTELDLRFGGHQGGERQEDHAFLTGHGRYTDDIRQAGGVHAAFVRSTLAHARVRHIDSSAARAMPGVLHVLSADDVDAAGLGEIAPAVLLPGSDGRPMVGPALPILTRTARYVGEAVALVVATTAEQAQAAAAQVQVDLDALEAAATLQKALASEAPQLWPQVPGNVALDWTHGDAAAVHAAFDSAHHRVALQVQMPRVAPSALEPRAAIGEYDADSGRYTLTAGTQGVALVSKILAEQVFKTTPDKLRVLTPDVGGGFGMKVQPYAEYAALLLAARICGRPVHWCASRLESFLADTHGRDGLLDGELALDAEGRFLALRVHSRVGIGAYASTFAAIIGTNNTKNCLSSVYRIPAIHMRAQLVLTNASPVGPYRGAGRPEAIYLVERLIETAARATGIDRVALRRLNLIPATAMPYAAPSGQTYDSGEFEAVLDKALALSEWQTFAQRRARSEAAGKLRGIGLCCFLEVAGGSPLTETVDLRVRSDGRVVLRSGAQAMGQGLRTTAPLALARMLDLPVSRIELVMGDSDEVPPGLATVASRTTMMLGGALRRAVDVLIDKGRELAAQHLEAGVADIEYRAGRFGVVGTDRQVAMEALADQGRLDTVANFNAPEMSFPNGCHVCEVEVDPDTGALQVLAYTAVDDVGHVVHPVIVEGQIHGGVAQGLGQVLGEQVVYDDEGQLLTASFMDYPVPRANDLPDIRHAHHVVPCTTNPSGVKGAGESGVAGSIPSATNAVLDALARRGVKHMDLPMTSSRVWAALQSARAPTR